MLSGQQAKERAREEIKEAISDGNLRFDELWMSPSSGTIHVVTPNGKTGLFNVHIKLMSGQYQIAIQREEERMIDGVPHHRSKRRAERDRFFQFAYEDERNFRSMIWAVRNEVASKQLYKMPETPSASDTSDLSEKLGEVIASTPEEAAQIIADILAAHLPAETISEVAQALTEANEARLSA